MKFAVSLALVLQTSIGLAAVPVNHTGPTLSMELIASYNEFKRTEKPKNWNYLIPENAPGMNGSQVASAMMDRGFQHWLKSDDVRNGGVGSTVHAVDQVMKQEVVMGAPGGIQHKINMQVLAFQGQAVMTYEGLTNASVYYSARDAVTGVEVFQKLSQTRDLVLSHVVRAKVVGSDDRMSNLSVRWVW